MVVLWCTVLYCLVLSVLCYVVLYSGIFLCSSVLYCVVMSYLVLCCLGVNLYCLVVSCAVFCLLSCLILRQLVLSCLVLSCLVLCCVVLYLSCPGYWTSLTENKKVTTRFSVITLSKQDGQGCNGSVQISMCESIKEKKIIRTWFSSKINKFIFGNLCKKTPRGSLSSWTDMRKVEILQ